MNNKQIDDAEIVPEDAKMLADNTEIEENIELPPRNPIANSPKNPKNKLNKEVLSKNKVKYRNDINNRYFFVSNLLFSHYIYKTLLEIHLYLIQLILLFYLYLKINSLPYLFATVNYPHE